MKILLVDDHVLIRDAMRSVLAELAPGASFLEATRAAEALELIAGHPELELVLLDLHLPDLGGFDVLADLREHHPALPVVILSVSRDRGDIEHALELGVLGFIPKSATREVLRSAFGLIFSGGVYVPPEILTPPRQSPASSSGPGTSRSPSESGLTRRQMEVLQLMMEGRSNKAICRALNLELPTVKNHVTAILRVLGVANRTEAVITADALGLGPRDH